MAGLRLIAEVVVTVSIGVLRRAVLPTTHTTSFLIVVVIARATAIVTAAPLCALSENKKRVGTRLIESLLYLVHLIYFRRGDLRRNFFCVETRQCNLQNKHTLTRLDEMMIDVFLCM